MLLLISDLHLSDGSTSSNPHGSAFKIVRDDVLSAAHDTEDGGKIEDIEIVLLGDIFDFVRTDYWLELSRDRRPWNGTLSPATGMNDRDADNVGHFQVVLDRILATAAANALIAVIKNVAEKSGKPTRVQYVIGNHDRVLNNYPALQTAIANAFAPVPIEFTNSVNEPGYSLVARHGHEWDEHCHGWRFASMLQNRKVGRFDADAYKVMAIGEVITAELMSGLVYNARKRVGDSDTDRRFMRVLRDVNNVRPMTHIVPWISWLMEHQTGQYLDVARGAFLDALDATLDSELARKWDGMKKDLVFTGDITDHLTKARFILKKQKDFRKLQSLVDKILDAKSFIDRIRGKEPKDTLAEGAFEEFKQAGAGTQFVAYGHTHQARQDYFTAKRDGKGMMYVNTGTFLPVTFKSARDEGFATSNRMSFISFFRSEEDRRDRFDQGPTVEVWDGAKRKQYVEK